MKKTIYFPRMFWFCRMLLFCLCLVLLSGCTSLFQKAKNENDIIIYYLQADGLKLLESQFTLSTEDKKGQVTEVVNKLYENSLSDDKKNILDSQIVLDDLAVTSVGEVTLYFSSSYSRLKASEEVIVRAALVKSITNIPDIRSVEFIIAGQPLADSYGEIGPMKVTDFIDSLASRESDRIIRLQLFYADKEGTGLIEKYVETRIKSNTTIERAIVESLIKGPSANDAYKSVPSNTQLLDINVKDDICYVDLSEEFLKGLSNVTSEVTIYSIVNSLTMQANISKVQFMIQGKMQKTYRELKDFDKLLERNSYLIVN